MSQMNGDMEWSFDTGWSWIAVVRLTATSQPRRKVFFEQGSRVNGEPGFTIQMDYLDRLSLVLRDRSGRLTGTPPIAPEIYAYRDVWLLAEIICDPFDPATRTRTLRSNLSVHGASATKEIVTTGDYGGPIEQGAYSFGASLAETDPATFRLYEFATLGRAPLTGTEKTDIAAHYQQKYDFGGGDD